MQQITVPILYLVPFNLTTFNLVKCMWFVATQHCTVTKVDPHAAEIYIARATMAQYSSSVPQPAHDEEGRQTMTFFL